jgi:hypothetical protein
MRLRHSFVSTLVRHAFAAITLSRSHLGCGHEARHDRRRQQKKRQQRNADFGKWLHSLQV